MTIVAPLTEHRLAGTAVKQLLFLQDNFLAVLAVHRARGVYQIVIGAIERLVRLAEAADL